MAVNFMFSAGFPQTLDFLPVVAMVSNMSAGCDAGSYHMQSELHICIARKITSFSSHDLNLAVEEEPLMPSEHKQ